MSKETRAGLIFGVTRARKIIKDTYPKKYIGETSPIFLAAVLEYLTDEILEISGNVTKNDKKNIITLKHIDDGIRNEHSNLNLNQLFRYYIDDAQNIVYYTRFGLYIKQVGKKVHPDLIISTDALVLLEKLIYSVALDIVKSISVYLNVNTITSRNIMFSVRFVLPNMLKQRAEKEGIKAVTKFTSC